jgi:hypothetical protein
MHWHKLINNTQIEKQRNHNKHTKKKKGHEPNFNFIANPKRIHKWQRQRQNLVERERFQLIRLTGAAATKLTLNLWLLVELDSLLKSTKNKTH